MNSSRGLTYFFSSPGRKVLMGMSGLIWAGFVMAHMAGNLLLFVGPEAYNKYAHTLTSSGLIYIAEAALITSLGLHVLTALALTYSNWRARGQVRYAAASKGSKAASLGSKTMMVHGTIILVFIITHIVHFKFGTYYETTIDGVVMRDLYRLVSESFQQPLIVFWYLLALVLLGLHLSHGFGSIFQSLGILNAKNRFVFNKLSWAYALIVAIGFISQPIFIFFVD